MSVDPTLHDKSQKKEISETVGTMRPPSGYLTNKEAIIPLQVHVMLCLVS